MKRSITQTDVPRDPRQTAPPAPSATMARLWSRRSSLNEIWQVIDAVGEWPDVMIVPDRTGLCVSLGGVVLGHLRWNGRVDLPFASQLRVRLLAEGMVDRDVEHRDPGHVVFD